MNGVQAQMINHPTTMLLMLSMTYLVNLGFQLIAVGIFWRLGREPALTGGLISGYRNISLAWAAVEGGVAPGAELYFARVLG